MTQRLLFWIFVSPILALETTFLARVVLSASPWIADLIRIYMTIEPYAALAMAALSFWSAYSFDKRPKLARAGMFIIGIGVLLLLM